MTLKRLGLTIDFPEGEDIWTESSYKFTRPGVEAMLAAADLELVEWHVDAAEYSRSRSRGRAHDRPPRRRGGVRGRRYSRARRTRSPRRARSTSTTT